MQRLITTAVAIECVKEAIRGYVQKGLPAPTTDTEFKTMMFTVMDENEWKQADKLPYDAVEKIFFALSAWAKEENIQEWVGSTSYLPFAIGAEEEQERQDQLEEELRSSK
jgi:hypothetical protein